MIEAASFALALAALAVFLRALRPALPSRRRIGPAVLALARGDFSVPADAEGKGELKMMANAVTQAQLQLSDIVTDIRHSTGDVERAVHKIEGGIGAVRQRTDQAAGQSGDVAEATIAPVSSTTRARDPLVPISIPRIGMTASRETRSG